jgi:hypothetical protein
MYVVTTDTYGGRYYIMEQLPVKWTDKLSQAILYEFVAEIPPLENDFDYIVKVGQDENGKLYIDHKH